MDSVEARFAQHLKSIKDKENKSVPRHFNSTQRNLERHLRIAMIFMEPDWRRLDDLETEFIQKFDTKEPKGLNAIL